jgi:hypothetical protein
MPCLARWRPLSCEALNKIAHCVPALHRRCCVVRGRRELQIERFDKLQGPYSIAMTDCGIERIEPEPVITERVEGVDVSKFCLASILGEGMALNSQ